MSKDNASSNFQTLTFVLILCLVCSGILSVLASVLKAPQEQAARVEQYSQMLRAAKIFHPKGYFLIKDAHGAYIPAKHSGNGLLVPGTENDRADAESILQVYGKRIKSFLVDNQGNMLPFAEAKIDEEEYVAEHWKEGFARLPLKIAYQILPNSNEGAKPEGYIIPVSGYGLWNIIAGYLAIEDDGIHVIGIAWYWQSETPGLGADIAEEKWQEQFAGKAIFQLIPNVPVDLNIAPMGITVVRGSVADVYGTSSKASSAVDGMAGATLTGSGVTKAYKDTLEAYRPFLVKVNDQYKTNH